MNEIAEFLVVLMAGLFLGGLFFGGLWWTVRRGLISDRPVLWFFGSTLLRTGLVVSGFYFISAGDWRKVLVCLLGFVMARFIITRVTRTTKEGIDAP
jgi:F1F0 ATPase subunit 2